MDLPVVIEIVDTADKIAAFIPYLDEVVKDGLVIVDEIRILKYHGGKPKEMTGK